MALAFDPPYQAFLQLSPLILKLLLIRINKLNQTR